MTDSFEQRIRRVMSGEARGLGASLARAGLCVLELPYTLATDRRNASYDQSPSRSRSLPRPVISIGNLTTGGTGKTPAVQWVVRELMSRGRRPAVLLRGYKKRGEASDKPSDEASDEEQLLRESLGCTVVANADRYEGGLQALKQDESIDTFVLDDGFQHRRLKRDLDIVLIDATNPFGYGHILPRGMLRERPAGIRRAHLILLTRTELADASTLDAIERTIRGYHDSIPIVRTTHTLGGVRGGVTGFLEAVANRKVFAFSGIGNPAAFETALRRAGLTLAGTRRFGDHHAYSEADVAALEAAACDSEADVLLTTEKDWTKVGRLIGDGRLPIACVGLTMTMDQASRSRVLETLDGVLRT